MSIVGEFNGPTRLVAGRMRGIRVFDDDNEGFLHPRSMAPDFIYKEGENVASHEGMYFGGGMWLPHLITIDGIPHRVAMENCTCGFYAYHNAQHVGVQGDGVLGIVEAWGRVTSGELGFRAEKLRIVALVESKSTEPGKRALQKRREALKRWSFNAFIAYIVWFVFLVTMLVTNHKGPVLFVTNIVFMTAYVTYQLTNMRRQRKATSKLLAVLSEPPKIDYRTDSHITRKIRARYPNTPVYASIEEALVDFPLSGPIQAEKWPKETKPEVPRFTCPGCGRTYYHPMDIRMQWCNYCKISTL